MNKCQICGNTCNNVIYEVKERQLNEGRCFSYLYCNKCGTLSLLEEISNSDKYYPKNYYAFNDKDIRSKSKLRYFLRKLFMAYNVTFGFWPFIRNQLKKILMPYMYLSKTGIHFNANILDVGCGNGKWLRLLKECGYKKLYGIDLFFDSDLAEGICFKQGDIFDQGLEKYDLITFHHSFEHMSNPESVLKRIGELLKPNGLCIIRTPVMECEAWDIWGTDWYQIDAPRHFFLYTERSLKYLCEKAGLSIKMIEYDSDASQFIYSRYYKETKMCLDDIKKVVTEQEFHMVDDLKEQVNRGKRGDQAVFYIKRN